MRAVPATTVLLVVPGAADVREIRRRAAAPGTAASRTKTTIKTRARVRTGRAAAAARNRQFPVIRLAAAEVRICLSWPSAAPRWQRPAISPRRGSPAAAVAAPRRFAALGIQDFPAAPQKNGQVAFTEWTTDGQLWPPRFQGLRDDKDPGDVVRELPN